MKPSSILTLMMLIQLNACYAQWISSNGPNGNVNVLTIVERDSLVIASTDHGYFSKNQFAANWMLNGASGFTCHTQKGDYLYVSDPNVGLRRFDLVNPNNPPVNLSAFFASTLEHSDSCLYMGSSLSGFYKSNTDGISWTQHNTGLPCDTISSPSGPVYLYRVLAIEVSDNYIFCGTDEGVYRNNVQLTQWASINSGLPLAQVTLIEEFNDTLYTVIANTLYRSINDGTNWNTIYTAPSEITSIERYNQAIYIGTRSNGIIRSLNNGSNWNLFNSGLTDLNVNVLSIHGNKLLCGTHSEGIFYFQGGQWINDRSGMICSTINSMTVTGNRLISDDNDKVYEYLSTGSWNNISPSVPHDMFSQLISRNDSVFLSVEYNSTSFPFDLPYILFSSDNGTTWSNLVNPVPFTGDDPYQIFYENGKLYAYENEKLSYTGNLGVNWINTSVGFPFCNGFNDFIVYHSIPYAAACSNAQVIHLMNNQNWTLSSITGLPNTAPQNFASCDNALFVNMANNGMYVTLDNGNTWSYANNGLPSNQYTFDFVSQGNKLFIATDHGVFATADYGQNWISLNQGLNNQNIWSIELFNDTLFAGTRGNGVWKLGLTDTHLGLDDYTEQFIKLHPNPAADAIVIETNETNSNYRIIDLFGIEILSGSLNTAGTICTSELKNGTYLVIIQTGKTVSSKKLIISR